MEKLKPWKTYSLDSNEHSWGYTILLPITDYFEYAKNRFRFRGWMLFANDGGGIIESKYGTFTIYLKDGQDEDVYVDEISKGRIGERWMSDYVIRGMIKDIFTKDITKGIY